VKSKPETIRLSDYRPCDYLIDTTDLSFELVPLKTAVKARLVIRPNQNTNRDGSAPLVLSGEALANKYGHRLTN